MDEVDRTATSPAARPCPGCLGSGTCFGCAWPPAAGSPHRRSIERELVWSGVDLAAASAAGRYVALDAADTLARLLEAGAPAPARFHQVVGGIVGGAVRAGGTVRIYGEMVALLQEAGDSAGALLLEELWNDLEGEHDFELLCGYPKSAFAGADAATQVHGLYDRHSHVVSARAGIAGPLSS